MQLDNPVLYHAKLCREGGGAGLLIPPIGLQDDHLLPEGCGLLHSGGVHQTPLQVEGLPVQVNLPGAAPVPDRVRTSGYNVQTAHDRKAEKTVRECSEILRCIH